MRKFEKVSKFINDENIIIPQRADKGSGCYDFYAPQATLLRKGEITLIPTGIKALMEERDVLLLFIRSSLGIKRNVYIPNGTGIIDSSYYNNEDNEGEIMIALSTTLPEIEIKQGERIVQGMFVKYLLTEDDKPLKDSRTGGIGSSGS